MPATPLNPSALNNIGPRMNILDLTNGNGPVTAIGKGPWLANPFNLASVHLLLTGPAGSCNAAVIIEGTNRPDIGDGGPVPLFTSDPNAARPGTLTDDGTGDAGSLMGISAYVRYNCTAISGSGAAVYPTLFGEPR